MMTECVLLGDYPLVKKTLNYMLQTVNIQSDISSWSLTGQWQQPFNASNTQEERFYVNKYTIVQVPMMFRSDKYYLAYDPTLKVGILKLPCEDGTAMLVLLPNEDVDYTHIEESITGHVFRGWVAKLKKTWVLSSAFLFFGMQIKK